MGFVLAHQEYEAWFLAGARRLAGFGGLPDDLVPPLDPEAIRDAKGWLSERMPRGQKYSPRDDQAAFTSRFDMDAAKQVGSFDKCYREIERLIRAVIGSELEARATRSGGVLLERGPDRLQSRTTMAY